MDLSPTAEQKLATESLERLLARFQPAAASVEFYLDGASLDAGLEDAGFHEIAADPDLGATSAVDAIIQVARHPVAVEIAATVLVRPKLCPDAPRPLALVWQGLPVRFGCEARTALIDVGKDVLRLDVEPGDFTRLESPFAYPLARITPSARARARSLGSGVLGSLRQYWAIGLTAEIAGAMMAALATTSEHVRQRVVFGRPIGAFQAVQHRLAEVAVLVEATRVLALNAASMGDASDAALAAGYAQEAARRVVYDCHQFLGAMGLTLEHPLHLWTYRLKALTGELGGAASRFEAAATQSWGEPSARAL